MSASLQLMPRLNNEKNDDRTKPAKHLEGAIPTINRILGQGKSIQDLTTEEEKQLGVAIHTIQDVVVHKGGRWGHEHWLHHIFRTIFHAMGIDGIVKSNNNNHPDVECTLGVGSDKALERTLQIVKSAMQNGSQNTPQNNTVITPGGEIPPP